MIECYHTGCKNHSIFKIPYIALEPSCSLSKCEMVLLPHVHTDEKGRIVSMRFPITIPEVFKETSAHEKALSRGRVKFINSESVV